MEQKNILGITEAERKELLVTIDSLRGKLDELIEAFYGYFLKTEAGFLFEHTDMNRQQLMFHSSIGVIITHIEHPYMLEQHLNQTITKHQAYGVTGRHVDLFIESFYKGLKDVFPDVVDKHKVEIWYKLISSVMLFFKNQLH